MADKPIGKITHYYDKIGVAVVKILTSLKVGDQVKISGHDKEFNQTINSMQIEHEPITAAKKGQIVGLKVDQAVKENDLMFLVK